MGLSKDPEKRARQLANLKPVDNTQKQRASELGKKGAKVTNEVLRRRKAFKELAKEMLELSLKDGKLDKLTSMEVKHKNLTVKEAMLFAQFKKAIQGDEQALKLILQFIGEPIFQPQEQITDNPEEKNDNSFINALNGVGEKVWEDEKES